MIKIVSEQECQHNHRNSLQGDLVRAAYMAMKYSIFKYIYCVSIPFSRHIFRNEVTRKVSQVPKSNESPGWPHCQSFILSPSYLGKHMLGFFHTCCSNKHHTVHSLWKETAGSLNFSELTLRESQRL